MPQYKADSTLTARIKHLAAKCPQDTKSDDTSGWMFGTGLTHAASSIPGEAEPLHVVTDLLQSLLADGDKEHARDLLSILTPAELRAMLPLTKGDIYSDDATAMRDAINARLRERV